MGTTSPDNIFFEDGATSYGNATNSALQATSIQNALSSRQRYTYLWPTATEKGAQTGMRNGDTGFQQDLQIEYTYTGTQWRVSGSSPWTSWTPTTTAINIGSTGTITSLYRYVGSKVDCKFIVQFSGTGASMGSNPTFSLPVPGETVISPYTVYDGNGSAYISSQVFPLFILSNNLSSTTCLIYALSATTAGYNNITATVPGTWASGSSFALYFSYLPA